MLTSPSNAFFEEFLNIGGYPELLGKPAPFILKLKKTLLIYGLIFLCLPAAGLLGYLADHIVTQNFHLKSIYNQADVSIEKMIHKIGRWETFAYVCLLGPLLEETIFRLPLSFKKNQVIFSGVFAAFFLGSLIYRYSIKNNWLEVSLVVALPIVTGIVLRYCISARFAGILKGFKTQLIIASICLFGLMHISNYIPIQWAVIFLYPVFVIPQMLMGWGFTYIRYKNGFFWGVAIHCLNNSVAMLLFAHFK